MHGGSVRRLIAATVLLATFVGVTAYAKRTRKEPLPEQAYAAKTIAIVNKADQQEFADTAFDALTRWGRFHVVQDSEKADIKLVISVASDNAGVVGSHGNVVDISSNWVTVRVFVRGQENPFYTTSAVIARLRKNATEKCIETFRKRLEEPQQP